MSAKKYDPTNNSLLINVNRQISREIDKNHIDNNDNDKPNINQQNKNSPDSTNTSHSSSPRFNYNSTLNKRQQSWVDPLEPRIHDTFYHKNLDTLRPRYSLLLKVKFIFITNLFFRSSKKFINFRSMGVSMQCLSPTLTIKDTVATLRVHHIFLTDHTLPRGNKTTHYKKFNKILV